jgi:Glucose / Sorbosone dehydrogenase
LLVLVALIALLGIGGGSGANALPTGFQETTVFSNLFAPVAIRFAADGRVFVAEQTGTIEVFDNLNDSTPDLFADLGPNVHSFWDRGLLGLALDPGFTTGRPYVYVLYTYDALERRRRRGATVARTRRGPPATAASSVPASRA